MVIKKKAKAEPKDIKKKAKISNPAKKAIISSKEKVFPKKLSPIKTTKPKEPPLLKKVIKKIQVFRDAKKELIKETLKKKVKQVVSKMAVSKKIDTPIFKAPPFEKKAPILPKADIEKKKMMSSLQPEKIDVPKVEKKKVWEEEKKESRKLKEDLKPAGTPKKPDVILKSPEEKVILKKEAVIEEIPLVPKKRVIQVKCPVSVKELSEKFRITPSELIKRLITKGIYANINQSLSEERVLELGAELGIEVEKLLDVEEESAKEAIPESDKSKWVLRAPIVTLMGHVDHGKTSLLDTIRKSKVTEKEHGGITQHIGAYSINLKKGSVTFLDTPGHEAFTAMRARGANATDIVVLVVGADDGVMPQTKEAVDHARAAEVPIVVAINKCDLPTANIEKVKKQLSELNLLAEDWSGKTIMVNVSAKTGVGIDELLEMLLLEAELLELKANPNTAAKGVVIEGKLSPGQGPVATVLVQTGTLRIGDMIVSGMYYGKVKAMINDLGHRVKEAPPSMPVEVMGLKGVPEAGDEFFVVNDERKAKEYCDSKQEKAKQASFSANKHVTLEHLYEEIQKGAIKELRLILKGDVQGSIEALEKSLSELDTKEVYLKFIHSDVGNVNDSDVVLAMASNAVIIGFHVRVEPKAHATAEKEGVEIKLYNIIYEAIADVKAAMEGMLEPILKKVFVGRALVRQMFKVSKIGLIAGCVVQKGKILRGSNMALLRNGVSIYEGKIISLKHLKDDVKEVAEGVECGIGIGPQEDIKAGDIIESFMIEKVARRL